MPLQDDVTRGGGAKKDDSKKKDGQWASSMYSLYAWQNPMQRKTNGGREVKLEAVK